MIGLRHRVHAVLGHAHILTKAPSRQNVYSAEKYGHFLPTTYLTSSHSHVVRPHIKVAIQDIHKYVNMYTPVHVNNTTHARFQIVNISTYPPTYPFNLTRSKKTKQKTTCPDSIKLNKTNGFSLSSMCQENEIPTSLKYTHTGEPHS